MAKLIDTVPIPIKESMEEASAKVLHTLHMYCRMQEVWKGVRQCLDFFWE